MVQDKDLRWFRAGARRWMKNPRRSARNQSKEISLSLSLFHFSEIGTVLSQFVKSLNRTELKVDVDEPQSIAMRRGVGLFGTSEARDDGEKAVRKEVCAVCLGRAPCVG